MVHAAEVEVSSKTDDMTEADATEADSSTGEAEPTKAKVKAPEPVSLAALFRYADAKDAMLLAAGTIAIMISGANQPLQLVVFGRLLDSFNDLDIDEAVAKINFFAACYAVLGVQQMITQSVQSACLSAAAARQTRRIRGLYFSSLARQPMSYADTNDCGALASGVLEATTIMAAGMGDELAKVAQTLLQFAIGLTVALVLSWRLALVSATGIPVLGFIVAVANKVRVEAYARLYALQQAFTLTRILRVGLRPFDARRLLRPRLRLLLRARGHRGCAYPQRIRARASRHRELRRQPARRVQAGHPHGARARRARGHDGADHVPALRLRAVVRLVTRGQ